MKQQTALEKIKRAELAPTSSALLLAIAPGDRECFDLENNLQAHSRCPAATTNEVIVEETAHGRVSDVQTGKSGLLRMVQYVEGLDAIFNFPPFIKSKNLEQAHVEVLDRLRTLGVAAESCRTGCDEACSCRCGDLHGVDIVAGHTR